MMTITLAEAADSFVAALRSRHAPINTVKAYVSDLRRFVQFVHSSPASPAQPLQAASLQIDLAQVDAAIIRAFLNIGGKGAKSRSDARARVSAP